METWGLKCEEWDSYTTHEGLGAGAGSNLKFVELSINPNDSIKLHFHAPFIDVDYKEMIFKLDDLDDGTPYGYKELVIKVVDLSCDLTYERSKMDWMKVGSYEYVKELKDKYEVENKELKQQIQQLKDEIAELELQRNPMINPDNPHDLVDLFKVVIGLGLAGAVVYALIVCFVYRKKKFHKNSHVN